MTLPELVGFFITILVLLYAVMRRVRDEKYRREHPKEYAEKKKQDEEAFKEFMRSLQIEVEEEEPPRVKPVPPRAMTPPPPLPPQAVQQVGKRDKFEFHHKMEGFDQHRKNKDRRLETSIGEFEESDLVSADLMAEGTAKALAGHMEGESPAREVVTELSDLKKMVLLHEVFGTPKALKRDANPWDI